MCEIVFKLFIQENKVDVKEEKNDKNSEFIIERIRNEKIINCEASKNSLRRERIIFGFEHSA